MTAEKPRSAQQLADQMEHLKRALRNEAGVGLFWEHDQAYSVAPGGSVLQPGAGKHKRTRDAKYVAYIARMLDAIPLHLRENLPLAWKQLTPQEQFVLYWYYPQDLPFKIIADYYGLSVSTVRRRHDEGLEHLAKQLWREDGSPNWGLGGHEKTPAQPKPDGGEG